MRLLSKNLPNVLQKSLKNVSKSASKNSPMIFLAANIALIGLTVYTTYKATKKTEKIIDEKEKEKGEPLTTKEKAKATWKEWVPVAVAATSAAGCAIASNHIMNTRVDGALATAAFYETKYKDVKKSLTNVMEGTTEEEKKEKADKAEAKASAERVTPDKKEESEIEDAYSNTIGGHIKYVDSVCGARFRCDELTIKKIEVKIARRTMEGDFVPWREFYDMLGLRDYPMYDACDEIGFVPGNPNFKFNVYAQVVNGVPVMVLSTNFISRAEYDRLYR